MTEQERVNLASSKIAQLCAELGVVIIPQVVSEFRGGQKIDIDIQISLRPVPNWTPPESGGQESPKQD